MKPPYYIAGETETKNRVDLYTFIQRQELTNLGLLMVYTDMTSGKVTYLCLPFQAEPAVWARYYDDLKYGGRDQPAMAFAIGSVLSKELSNVMISGSVGDDYQVESSDYDICFPAGSFVQMADGTKKPIEQVQVGDQVLSIGASGEQVITEVTALEVHETVVPLVKVISLPSYMQTAALGTLSLPQVQLLATANHPVLTPGGLMSMGELVPAQRIIGFFDGEVQSFEVKYVSVSGSAPTVYNLKTASGTYVVNGVSVSDK